MLFLYMYAVLGMNLFASIKITEPINEYSNFQNVGSSMLVLLISSTGEGWEEIMLSLGKRSHMEYNCILNPTY